MNPRFLFGIIAICGTGAFTGAMLTIYLTLGASWRSLPPAEFLDWWAANESLIVRSITVVAIPSAIGLTGSLILSLRQPSSRLWWMIAAGAIVVLAIITVVFHLPINASFAARTVPIEEVGATIDSWLAVHSVRIALGLIATVSGIIAITR